MIRAVLSIIFLALTFSGCSLVYDPQYVPNEHKKAIYLDVHQKVTKMSQEAKALEEEGYIAQAANYYEQINYYQDEEVIPYEKITQLKETALKEGQRHYDDANASMQKKEKLKALVSLNNMMRNTPVEEGEILLETLREDPEIISFLFEKEQELSMALAENQQKSSHIKRIYDAMNILKKYDDANNVLLQAKQTIQNGRDALIKDAVSFYNKGHYATAQKKFIQINLIYEEDATANTYLARIRAKRSVNAITTQAQSALNDKNYPQAIAFAQDALKKSPNNQKAKRIIAQAKEAQKAQIPKLIEEGKHFYTTQDFAKAKATFEKILEAAPEHNTSLTYIKKINRQLQTLKSLQ